MNVRQIKLFLIKKVLILDAFSDFRVREKRVKGLISVRKMVNMNLHSYYNKGGVSSRNMNIIFKLQFLLMMIPCIF